MNTAPPALMLTGAIAAMAFGAVMVFVSRRRGFDFVALWLGLFLFCIAASLYFGRGAVGGTTAILALPFLALFVKGPR